MGDRLASYDSVDSLASDFDLPPKHPNGNQLTGTVRNRLRNIKKALRDSVNETCTAAMNAADKFRRASRDNSPNPSLGGNPIRKRSGSKDIFNIPKNSCPGCTKPLSDPKLLPCAHTICGECAIKLTIPKGDENQEGFVCPVCQTKIQIEQGGQFEDNLIIKSLLEMYNKVLGDGGQCSNDGVVTGQHGLATHICLQCREDLCEYCSQHHTQTSLTATHDVVAHIKLNAGHFKALQRERKMFCLEHKGKVLDIYCRNCKESVCSQCLVGKHQRHECCSIEEAADTERNKIKDALLMEETNVADSSLALNRANEELKYDLDYNVSQTEQMIDSTADSLIHTFSRCINKKRRELLTKLREFEEEQKSFLRQHKTALSSHHIAVKSMQDLTSLIYQHGSAVEVMRHSENLQERARQLKEQGSTLRDESWRRKLIFNKNENEIKPKDNIIGDILEECFNNKINETNNAKQ